MALIAALAVSGLVIGRRIGLGAEARGLNRPILFPLAVGAAVAVSCALSDWLMRAGVHPGYVAFMTSTPVATRIAFYMMRAFNENILYRLFLASLLIWLIGGVWKGGDGRPAAGAYWAGFVLSQVINIWINSTSLAPMTSVALLHDALRYVVPGIVYGWLYWRHGFQSCEIACTGVHVFLQPLVTLGLG